MATTETGFSTPYETHQQSTRQIGRFQKSVVVHQRQELEPVKSEPRSSSPKVPEKPGDRHLTIGIVILVVSLIFFNPLTLSCAIPAVWFSIRSRKAEMNGKQDHMQENDKTAFAFVIFSIIGWIVSLCVIGFVIYREYCGPTGAMCETRTHV